jgi:hypothetical protein
MSCDAIGAIATECMSVPTSAVARSLSDVIGSVRQRIGRARKIICYQFIKLFPSFVIAYALEMRRRAARSGGNIF